eukprot:10740284-Lingulodinium_polyedra.AAC.1
MLLLGRAAGLRRHLGSPSRRLMMRQATASSRCSRPPAQAARVFRFRAELAITHAPAREGHPWNQ